MLLDLFRFARHAAVAACMVAVPVSAETTRVYRCLGDDGRLTFAQTPCREGIQEELRIKDVKVGWDAPAVQVEVPRKAAKRTRREASKVARRSAKNAEKCFKKSQQLETINRKLRRGYKAGKGADLRHRRRQYEDYLSRFCE